MIVLIIMSVVILIMMTTSVVILIMMTTSANVQSHLASSFTDDGNAS